MAGKVDVCCFDKTGTLTSDEMVLRGVRLRHGGSNMIRCADGTIAGNNEDLVLPTSENDIDNNGTNEASGSEMDTPIETLRVMVACHGLATRPSPKTRGMTQEVIGDPFEKAVLTGCGWQLVRGDVVTPPIAIARAPRSWATTATHLKPSKRYKDCPSVRVYVQVAKDVNSSYRSCEWRRQAIF